MLSILAWTLDNYFLLSSDTQIQSADFIAISQQSHRHRKFKEAPGSFPIRSYALGRCGPLFLLSPSENHIQPKCQVLVGGVVENSLSCVDDC